MNDQRSVSGLRDRHAILILLFLTIALFRRALFNGDAILSSPVFFDLTHSIYPWRLFGFNLLKDGIVPLWNPYNFCGTPFVANWHSAMFYPLNFIFFFLPPQIAINYSIAFHFFITGVFTYAFVRYLLGDRLCALVSAIVFIFSGPYLVQLFPGHIFNPLPWFPLSLLLAEIALRRKKMRYYVFLGCVLALQILAGHPQYMVYCLGGLVLYLAFRTLCDCRDEKCISPVGYMCAGLAVILAVGIALSAVQLLPSWEFKNQSARALLSGPKAVSDVSFPPENVITLIAPEFFGNMYGVRYWGRWLLWETCAYVGILPLVCALMGALFVRNRYTKFFSGLALLALLLAFGAYSPLFEMLYHYVPGFALFRGQAKFIFLTTFSLSVLAGYGCRHLLRRSEERKKGLLLFGGATLVTALLMLLLCVIAAAGGGERSSLWQAVLRCRAAGGFEGTPPPHPADVQLIRAAYKGASTGMIAAAVWLGISSTIIMYAGLTNRLRAWVGALIIFVCLADLWHYGSKYIIVSPLSSCRWPVGVTDFFAPDRLDYRILAPNIGVPGANQNMTEGIYSIDGYETMNVGCYKEYVDYSQGVSSATQLTFAINTVTPMLEALGLRYLVLPDRQRFVRAGYRLGFTGKGANIYEREAPIPRAYAVHKARIISDRARILYELNRGFDFAREVIIEKAPGVALPGKTVEGRLSRVELVSSLPHEVVIRATLPDAGVLVLSDVYYPGWTASVDGRRSEILRANYAFRAVALGRRGEHTVVFRYEPRSFTLGARITLGALVALVIYFCILAVRRRGWSDPLR
jgi:hypothetical protein